MSAPTVEEIEARRSARKAALAEQERAQLAIDLAALDDLEVAHGDSNVARLDVPYTPGLPTMAVVRVPKPAEVKRYRARLKEKNPDPQAAADEIGASTRVYPPRPPDETPDVFDAMCEARPGLVGQLGVAAMGLAVAREHDEGKG